MGGRHHASVIDAALTQLWPRVSRSISIDSNPDGADVFYRAFGHARDPWRRLANTPIRDARIPLGSLEWQISKPGYATVQDVGLLAPYLTIRDRAPRVPYAYVLDSPERLPSGMARVSTRGPQLLAIAGLEHVPPFEIGEFWIDRYEVTNRDFKRFVDAGGYRDPRHWQQPFVKDGRSLSWEEATAARKVSILIRAEVVVAPQLDADADPCGFGA